MSGHHSVYLRHVVDAFVGAGAKVSLALRRKDWEHWRESWEDASIGRENVHLLELPEELCAKAERSRLGLVGKEIELRRVIARVFRTVSHSTRIDYAFMPYADYCLYAIGLLGSPFGRVPWGGICMRPSFHHSAEGLAPGGKLDWLKEAIFNRVLRQPELGTLFCIDELLPHYLRRRTGKASVVHLPDPATPPSRGGRQAARARLNIPDEATVLLAFGAISTRKGMRVLLQAFSRSLIPKQLVLLVVGRQTSEFKQSQARTDLDSLVEGGRAVVVDSFVDQEMQDAAFEAANAVWLGYENHYAMSGVLVLAAQSRRMIIGTRKGLIGYHTKRHRLGVAIDTTDVELVAAELCKLSSTRWNPPSETIFDDYTWPQFKKTIGCIVSSHAKKERIGGPAAGDATLR